MEIINRSKQYECVFTHFDDNHDGKISPSELRHCLAAIGGDLSESEAESVVLLMDSDGDGELGLEDFVRLVDAPEEGERERDLREAFGMYEMGGSGCITPKSLKRMLKKLGEKKTIGDCVSMIKEFDLDGDGVLSFDEFKIMDGMSTIKELDRNSDGCLSFEEFKAVMA